MSHPFISSYPSFHWSTSVRAIKAQISFPLHQGIKIHQLINTHWKKKKKKSFHRVRQPCMKGKCYSFNTTVPPKNLFNLYLYLFLYSSCVLYWSQSCMHHIVTKYNKGGSFYLSIYL